MVRDPEASRASRVAISVALLGCAWAALGWPAGAQPRPALRVLFVGNSHTYTHDIPSLVSAIAASATGARPLVVATSITIPGACLADHRRDGRAEQAIRTGRFDVVVLQECGGGVARNRPRYWRGARTFQADIARSGARTVLAMVHSYRTGGNGTTDAIAASVRPLARELGATVTPHAIAWAALHRALPREPLFLPDGYHPSLVAAYLDACTTYATLTCASPEGVTRETPEGAIAPDVASAVWRAAWQSVRAERTGCLPAAPAARDPRPSPDR